jgi:hypothetical protein
MVLDAFNRLRVTITRRTPQLFGQPTELPDIQTLREYLLRHAIPLDRAPGPRLEAYTKMTRLTDREADTVLPAGPGAASPRSIDSTEVVKLHAHRDASRPAPLTRRAPKA